MREAARREIAHAPDPITTDRYIDQETRIVRLEEYRKSHDDVHDKHVATKDWVRRMGWAAVGALTTLSTVIATLLVRLLFG